VAREARRSGRRLIGVLIREEASPALEAELDSFEWVGLGQLGRCIEVLRAAGAEEAVMAGQVKHRQIFSGIVPDLTLLGVLTRLAFKNTDSLIGGVAEALGRAGIRLVSSTQLLGEHLASPGAMTQRRPSPGEANDVEYGVRVARELTRLDLGQTVVVKDRAAVALEAMEGTDEVIRRAGALAGPGCVVVKLAKPRQDMRFDVPVVGEGTLEAMRAAGSALLAVEARRTLLLDRPQFLAAADAAGLCVFGIESAHGGAA
jgi:DUF1009 family protein